MVPAKIRFIIRKVWVQVITCKIFPIIFFYFIFTFFQECLTIESNNIIDKQAQCTFYFGIFLYLPTILFRSFLYLLPYTGSLSNTFSKNLLEKELENGKAVAYKIKFIDSLKFMSSSLSRLADNLGKEIHNNKCKGCKFHLEYIKRKDKL